MAFFSLFSWSVLLIQLRGSSELLKLAISSAVFVVEACGGVQKEWRKEIQAWNELSQPSGCQSQAPSYRKTDKRQTDKHKER